VDVYSEIIKVVDEVRQSQRARKFKSKSGLKPKKLGKTRKGVKWSSFKTGALSMPLAMEMMRAHHAAPPTQGQSAVLESGVLAFRRESDGDPRILLISRKRSKRWGIPKGKVEPTLTFPETAAKEAFEEAGVIGYISPSSVGMFRAKKRAGNPPVQQLIEVWVYLLEVTELASDWPERDKRATRWVTCEAAAEHLREPVLAHLCHRLAQG
jgi:8-oxo-dGTP pyrophosphatase MutT (NUDIX family)